MSSPSVRVERQDTVALVILDRAGNRNSMTPELLDGYAHAIRQVRAMADVRCVVLTGEGPSFSAGADFRSQIQREEEGRTTGEKSFAMYTPFLSTLEIEVPVLGALQGHAVGGGFGLCLTADVRIASSTSKYGANFARLGLHPGMAVTYLLPRLVGVPRAMELLLTGRLFSGEEGKQFGLFHDALATEQVLPATLEMARTIAANAPAAVRLMKRMIYQGLQWQPQQAAWLEAFAQAATVGMDDAREGMAALLEKRPPHFTGR
jgi:enoyl-CoA hydratase/carnithine racemase